MVGHRRKVGEQGVKWQLSGCVEQCMSLQCAQVACTTHPKESTLSGREEIDRPGVEGVRRIVHLLGHVKTVVHGHEHGCRLGKGGGGDNSSLTVNTFLASCLASLHTERYKDRSLLASRRCCW